MTNIADRVTTRRRLIVGVAAATGGTLMVNGTACAAGPDNAAISREFFALLSRKDVEGWSRLWAEDGRILVPYPPEGFADVIDGRANIVSGFRDLFANFETFDTRLSGVYPTTDSDAVTVQYLVDAWLRTGEHYTNSNIAVFRFNGGLITEYHDYFDPRRFQVVVDALPSEGNR